MLLQYFATYHFAESAILTRSLRAVIDANFTVSARKSILAGARVISGGLIGANSTVHARLVSRAIVEICNQDRFW